MTVSATSPADVINLALARIGKEDSIGHPFDGSRNAQLALTLYGQTRDEILREQDWGFAERSGSLTLLKTAPAGGYIPPTVWTTAYPPLPWLYEYAYPGDCLKVRAVKASPLFVPNFDPQPQVFRTPNDNQLVPAQKVIVCNVPAAIAIYTGRVTDPKTWEPLFVEALAASLGRRLAPALANPDMVKFEAADEQAETTMADMRQG